MVDSINTTASTQPTPVIHQAVQQEREVASPAPQKAVEETETDSENRDSGDPDRGNLLDISA
jgi:hypothetical protein